MNNTKKIIDIDYFSDLSKNTTGVYRNYLGNIKYLVSGKMHRLNGPAFIWNNKKYHNVYEYWITGKQVTKEQHELLFNLYKLKDVA